MESKEVQAVLRAMKQERKKPIVTGCDVWRQVVRDWTDKEVQHTYTTTYIWMTNQLGHFTLGFLGTYLIVWIVEFVHGRLACDPPPGFFSEDCPIDRAHFVGGWMLVIPAAELVIWGLKELRDWLATRKEAAHNSFKFNGREVAWDAATAVFFIAVGTAVAYLSFITWSGAVIAFLGGLAVSLIPAMYWLSRKLCFQQAALPFLFRLADFEGRFRSEQQDVRTVNEFLAGRFEHLLIFGAPGTGRTSLAVAMATEHAFVAVGSARYLSWAKFVEDAQVDPEPTVQDGIRVWPWRESEIVVLDDVVKVLNGHPDTPSDQIGDLLRKLPPGVRETLGKRRTIWVLGPVQDAWVEALVQALGAAKADFRMVEMANLPVRQGPKRRYAQFSGT
jgi:hypothetical protein